MHRYVTYGLRVQSEIPLPELVEGESGSDAHVPDAHVSVRLGRVELGACDAAASRPELAVSADGSRLRLSGIASYWVREGREIIIDPLPGAEPGVVRLNLLGLCMGILMHQRGLAVLHASVVNVGGGAVAFLGFSGEGKSTTAGAMLGRGHSVVCDDVAAIEVDAAAGPVIYPAAPELRLLPESADSLRLSPAALITRFAGSDKQSCRDAARFRNTALPLRRIYVLHSGDRNEITPLAPATACIEFMRHSLVAGIFKPSGTAAAHFQRCVRLAQSVPIARLSRRRSLAELDALTNLIEEDLVQIG